MIEDMKGRSVGLIQICEFFVDETISAAREQVFQQSNHSSKSLQLESRRSWQRTKRSRQKQSGNAARKQTTVRCEALSGAGVVLEVADELVDRFEGGYG